MGCTQIELDYHDTAETGRTINLMELFGHCRLAVPKLFSGLRQKTYVDINVQVLNLLGNKDYESIGTVLGSPLLGQPLAAIPGRSLRYSFSFSR